MSLLVHGLFLTFILFGISWRNLPQLPVEAELWNALPEPPPVIPLEAPALPEPVATPVTPKLEAPEPKIIAKPDIALEKADKKRREQEARMQEALRLQERAEQEHRAELQRQAMETARIEKEKAEQLRLEQLRREQARREMEQELAREARDALDAEETQLRSTIQKQQQARASRHAQLIGEYQDRIRGKIRGYLRLPQTLRGNPEVAFQVTLLPNGEVVRVVLVKGSGQAAYDQEMERAIVKASPLPLPRDRDAAAVFRDGLILKFRPREEGGEAR